MKFIILPLLFILTFAGAHSQSVIQLNESNNWKAIGRSTSFFRDPGTITIENILQPAVQSQFKSYDQLSPNFGSTDDAVWFKFEVIKEIDNDFYLQIGSPFIDSIALYAVHENHVQEVQLSGDNYSFSQRAVRVNTFLFPLNTKPGEKQTYYLRTKTMQPFFFPLRVGSLKSFMEDAHKLDFIQGIYLGFMLLILLYNLFLYFSTREKIYVYYVAYVLGITWFMSTIFQYVFEFIWPSYPLLNQYAVASTAITILAATLFTREFLNTSRLVPRLHKISNIFMAWAVVVFVLVFTDFKIPALMLAQAGIMLMAIYFLITGITVYRQGYHPAKFYLLAWSSLILGFIAAILETVNLLPVMYYINSMQIGSAIEVTLLSFALADRINIYKKQREEAQEKALVLAQEKADIIHEQNIVLEQKVAERTNELKQSLDHLKETQSQLIQSEKMASLGQLTAGIAHEIQNPLNFVNNFSEVSNELLEEMMEASAKGNLEEVKEILKDVKQNLEKINHHGKRADGIVKGMLQHSRSSSGVKEPTDINALADEYLRLAYHGLRAKDKSFNAKMNTDFDESLEKVNVIPQDIGRVILNLITNAFHAVDEKKKSGLENYEPTITVLTKKNNGLVKVSVQDNGNGIPQKAFDKIFQPFFTTKPTGQGTGLGLSLAYDIVKTHGGELTVETMEGEGSKFIMQIPI